MNEKEKAFYTEEHEQIASWLSQYWELVTLGIHLLLKTGL